RMAIQQTRRALAPTHEQPSKAAPGEQQHAWQDREQQRQNASKDARQERLRTALGWFSIGLGLAEVLAPKGLARVIGVRADHSVLFVTLRFSHLNIISTMNACAHLASQRSARNAPNYICHQPVNDVRSQTVDMRRKRILCRRF